MRDPGQGVGSGPSSLHQRRGGGGRRARDTRYNGPGREKVSPPYRSPSPFGVAPSFVWASWALRYFWQTSGSDGGPSDRGSRTVPQPVHPRAPAPTGAAPSARLAADCPLTPTNSGAPGTSTSWPMPSPAGLVDLPNGVPCCLLFVLAHHSDDRALWGALVRGVSADAFLPRWACAQGRLLLGPGGPAVPRRGDYSPVGGCG